jgi:hypothetical protein
MDAWEDMMVASAGGDNETWEIEGSGARGFSMEKG